MKAAFGLFGAIFIAVATALYNTGQKPSGLACAITGILIYVVLACLYIKDRHAVKHDGAGPHGSSGFIVSAVGTDENTRLVIKAIGNGAHGPIDFNEIVNNTNLPLKAVNKVLDWLFLNNFAIEQKGRRGKVYELTLEGKSVFSQLIKNNRGINQNS